MPGWDWQKIEEKLSNTLRLNFCYLKITHFLHPPSTNHRRHSKKCTQNKYVFNWGYIINGNEIMLKMKNRSYRYDINRPRPRHGHKYTKYKMRLRIMMVTGIKQHRSNI